MQHKKSNRVGHALLAALTSPEQRVHSGAEPHQNSPAPSSEPIDSLQVAEPRCRFDLRRLSPRSLPSLPRRTACVALPNWPIQRLVVASPDYRGTPLVLFTETGNRGQLVTAASPRAQLSGVRIGMPLTEAKSLLRRSVGSRGRSSSARHVCDASFSPTFLPATPQADRLGLAALARQLQEFSPLVGVLSALGSDGESHDAIWLDLTGVAHLFGDLPGSERNLLQAVRDRLASAGYLAITAVADTPAAAWALACYGQPRRAPARPSQGAAWVEEPELAPLAQAIPGKPRALSKTLADHTATSPAPQWQLPAFEPIIAPLEAGWSPLDSLPPAALRLDPLVCLTLRQLGIHRIGQLRQLPRPSLQARFGSQLVRRLDETSGQATEIWPPLEELLDDAIDQTFDFPLRDLPTIQVVIERQLEQLCTRLRPLQRGALQWLISLRGEASPAPPSRCPETPAPDEPAPVPGSARQSRYLARLVINHFQPTATVAHVMQLVAMQLEQQRDLDLESQPVWEVSVRAARCVLLAEKQRLLFDDDPRLDRQALSQLLDRLAVRLGPERIVRPVPVSGAQPEFASRNHMLVGNDQAPPRVVSPRREHSAISRPVRLLQPPRPLAVVTNATSGAPEQLHYSRGNPQVLAAWGPERIETGWWRARLVSRDYWRVQTSHGQLLWLYQDLATQQWFLHGTF